MNDGGDQCFKNEAKVSLAEEMKTKVKTSRYSNVIIGRDERSLLGWKLEIYLFIVEGLLIDTGPYSLRKSSSRFILENHIQQAALTHLHEDHSGMAAWLQKDLQVPVYLHGQAVSFAGKRAKYGLYRHLIWGKRPAFHPQLIPEVLTTDNYTFNVIDSPGHCPYHKVFHEKNQGWLFTGDLYVGNRQIVAFYDENMKDTIASIQKVLTLEFDTVFCSHSGVVENGKTMFREKLDFLLDLQVRVNTLRKQGMTDHEIDRKLYPRVLPITKVSSGEWSSYNMVSTI